MKLLDRVREVARLRHLALATEDIYAGWVERFLRFSKVGEAWRLSEHMGAAEDEALLNLFATKSRVLPSTQNQALSALLFLYRDVLRIEPGDVGTTRTRRWLPFILSSEEAAALP